MKEIIIGLAIALALSLLGNAALGWQWLQARDRATAAESARDQWQSQAETCGKSVTQLQTKAAAQKKAGAASAAAAATQAQGHDQKADAILSAPAAVRGEDCKSAATRAAGWLKGRAAP